MGSNLSCACPCIQRGILNEGIDTWSIMTIRLLCEMMQKGMSEAMKGLFTATAK